FRHETSSPFAQIELAFGPVPENRPAIRSDEKGGRNDGAEHRPVPSAPTRLHRVKRAAPIKLLRALAEAQHGSVRVKCDRGVRRRGVIKGEFLHEFSILAPYRHSQRLSFDGHAEPAGAKLLRARHLASAQLVR